MKGLWILGGLVATALALAWLFGRDSTADLERLHAATVRERPAIADALEKCGDLVRHFSDIKPTERKKGELEALRRRFEKLERTAYGAMEDAATPRDERKRTLARIEEDFHSLLVDAEDLHARLREMKHFSDQLQPRIAKLGQLTQQLLAAQSGESTPEFQQRAGQLIEDGRKFRLMAETALRTLSVKILDGRTTGMTALNELDETLLHMEELLAARSAPAPAGETKDGETKDGG